MKRRPLLWLALALLWGMLSACAGGQVETPPPEQAAAPSALQPPAPSEAQAAAKANGANLAPFVLGAGDTVNITVWRIDDLKRTVQIDPSGYISFPFTGQVQATGLTMDQLAKRLEKGLSDYYVNPRVDIALSTVRSASVHVLGEVKGPTSITLDKRVLLNEAIARAGGLGPDADEERILLFRRDGDVYRAQVVSLRLKDKADGQTLLPLTFLVNEDIVYVPPVQIVDATRFLSQLVGILEPFTSVGRSIVFGDQVYKLFVGQSTGVVVQP